VRALREQLRSLPTLDPQDPGYRRLRYLRYADDTLLGFAGPKAEAEQIKARLAQFLRDDLKLELSEEKTLITHARTGAARFLGYEITVQHGNRKIVRGRRAVNGSIRLRVPRSVIKAKSARYMQRGKPARRTQLMNIDDHDIIGIYGAEYRGIVQYYLLAGDVARLSRLHWVMVTSLLKTLAGKYDSSVTKMARKYQSTIQTPYGPRKCMQVSVERGEGRKPLVARFGGIPLRRQKNAVPVDREPVPGHCPPQGADPSAPGRTVRAVRASGDGARSPDPQTRRPRNAQTASNAGMDGNHGPAPTQDPRGLSALPQHHPQPAANRITHAVITWGALKVPDTGPIRV
jgi:Type II intron maturase